MLILPKFLTAAFGTIASLVPSVLASRDCYDNSWRQLFSTRALQIGQVTPTHVRLNLRATRTFGQCSPDTFTVCLSSVHSLNVEHDNFDIGLFKEYNAYL